MSFNPAHPKKQVGVPQTYQQTRHSSAPRHQQQYRSQHPQARDARYLNQPPRHPSPIPNQGPSPSASPNTVPQQPPTALGTGTHDMNKQGAPNRPALTPSPVQQGTILPGQPGIIINPQQIMYQQQNMSRGAPQQAMYVPIQQANQRGNPPRAYQTSNMSQTQQGGQPQATFQPSHQQMTMAAPPFIPSSHHHQPQQPSQFVMTPQMMMQQANMYAPRQPVHQLQYQQTAYVQQPNTPPFYQGSPPVSAAAGAFFPQNQTLVATQAPQLRAQGPTMTIQPTQPRPPPKERKIIRIVDPTTNSDITDSIMREGGSSTGSTPTQSGRSSASSTPPASGPPPPTQQIQVNDKARAIQASFAAQVAAAASADATKPPPVMTNNSQQFVMRPPQQPFRMPAPQPQKAALAPVVPPQKEITEAPKQTVIVDNTSVGVPMTIASQVQKQPSLPIRPSEVAPAPTSQVTSHVGPIPAPVPAKAVPIPTEVVTDTKPSEAKSNSAPEESTESVSKESIETSQSVSQEQVPPVSAEKTDSKPKLDIDASKEDTTPKDDEPVTEKLPVEDVPKAEDSKSDETAKQETETKSLPQEKSEEKPSAVTVEAPTPKEEPTVEATQAPAKENKKKTNQKKRLQELDKKETKTDDLEAFKDPEPSESTPNVTATEEKKQETKEVTPEIEKAKQEQTLPEKAPVKEETKPELPKSEQKEESKPDVESEEVSEEKDVPKVEVAVVDSVDKIEREKVEAENAKNKESMDNEDDSNKPGPKDDKIQLKYTYRENQWSPVNPEGKKQYGRDFLLQFQPECKDKPDGLPHIPDIVLDKADIRPIAGVAEPRLTAPGGGGARSRGGDGGGADFMPAYMRSPRGNEPRPQFPMKGGGGGGGGRRSSREPKVIQRNEKGPEPTLKKSENAWKPESKRAAEKPKTDEDAKTAELMKSFKSILNKLTPQNFQTLMAKTLELPIDNEERLTVVIDLVFEKAISESAFSKAYANMCRVLSQVKVPAKNGLVQFRTVLINRCQRAFEADKKEEAICEEMKKQIEKLEKKTPARNRLEDELFIAETKAKRKVLGNMRFIGELFKLRMLTENIMHDCIFKLLRSKDDESLECMSQLMITVGKDLDHERAKNRMDQYFTQIKKITGNQAISARIRFMLQDVEDLRRCNWIPRRDKDAPKTIAQIHQDAKQEEQKKKIESHMTQQSSKSREGRSGGRGGKPGPPQPDSDWQTVSVNKARPQVDPSKLINLSKNRPDNDNVQLGPGGRPGAFGSWGRGSSGGGAKTQSAEQVDLRPAGNNRYAMLSDQGRGSRPGMAPPTRDSKGRPTGNTPARRSRERDEGRGGSREDSRRERRQLLDEVSRTMGGGGNRSSSQEKDRRSSRDRVIERGSRDSRGSRERGSRDRGSRERGSRERGSQERGSTDRGSWEKAPAPASKAASKPPASTLTDDEVKTKGKATLDEYLNIRDMKEACLCMTELNSNDRLHLIVTTSIEHVLEMDAKSRLATGTLFHRLIQENILSVQQYLQGLNEILEFADDMAIDIPLIWQYLGEVMGSIIQDKSQSIEYLGKALEPVKVAGKAGVLLAEIMKTAEKNIGAEGLNELWQATGFKWEQFLPSDENAAEFVKEKKLEYTLVTLQTLPKRTDDNPLALMEKDLGFILANGEKVVNDEVFNWINKHIDPELTKSREFIRALVTVVCQHTIAEDSSNIRCDPELLKFRAKCLLRYIDGDVDRELQALYAVQALNHKLVNPPGFLRIIFDILYDEDVISEETFYAWQNSKEEQNGKGIAIKSVTSFFAWLGEAEEETAN